MHIISSWITKICIAAIFIIICDMIVPKKFKNICNMILGIMMILIIISPISNVILNKNVLDKKILENNNFLYKSNIYINKSLKDVQSKSINDIYKKQVEEQLDVLIKQNFHITDVNIKINSKIDEDNNFSILNVDAAIGKTNDRQNTENVNVKPVNIDVDNKTNIKDQHDDAESSSNDYKQSNNIREYISKFLNVAIDKVNIRVL